MSRILATDFGIWPTFRDIAESSDAMMASASHRENLANYLLMYEQIVIPTGNLQILPVLRHMLGEGIFDELVRNREIVLARYSRWFAYGGNGAGIIFFSAADNPTQPPRGPNLGKGYFKELDEAIDVALATTTPQLGQQRNSSLRNLLQDSVIELPTEELQRDIPEETYRDILNSEYLRDMMSLRNAGKSLKKLTGIGPNQMTIYNPQKDEAGDIPEIKAVLRVAFENFILGVASHAQADSIASNEATLSIVRAKGQRLGKAIEGNDAFVAIQNIAGVPNVGKAFSARELRPEQILELRRSRNGEEFRKWFGYGSPTLSAEEQVERYREAVSERGWLNSLPLKVLRLATTSLAGLVSPVSGAAASAIDSIMLEKWFPKRGPQLFLEETKNLIQKNKQARFPKPMHGRDRNKPCPCGSGKKFKVCHGRVEPQID
ncbi:SEC-C domain-containing protein [Marinobacter sp.]|uniref:SEC-C domain-containing protein n=1 Tax=Marinobacter sp. TaxID=50741 RepID=UPI0035C6A77B